MFAVDEVIEESHAAADCTGFISHVEWRKDGEILHVYPQSVQIVNSQIVKWLVAIHCSYS